MSYFPLKNEGLPIGRLDPVPDEIMPDGTIPVFLGNRFTTRKLFIFFFLGGLIFITFIFRLAYFELARGAYYRSLAEGNRIRIMPLRAKRGLIVDRNNILLAVNTPVVRAEIVPAELTQDPHERAKIIQRLAETIGGSSDEIESEIQTGDESPATTILLANTLNDDEAIRLMTRFANIPGVNANITSARAYPFSTDYPSIANILGYQGKISREEFQSHQEQGYLWNDSIGKTGLEQSYESFLRGTYGQARVEVNAEGIKERIVESERKIDGDTLRLALDIRLQQSAERALEAGLKKKNLKKGAVVALNPQNGEILVLVSLPAYNNATLSSGINSEEYSRLLKSNDLSLFPRAIAGEYPSGSVIKPIFAAAALAKGIITPQTQVLSSGGIRIGKWFFPDWKAGGHGLVNVRRAISESVNTFFYALGGGYEEIKGLGLEGLHQAALAFGFSAKTGIDLPSEAEGFFPTEAWRLKTQGTPWYIGDTYHAAIGQGDVLVTPLQIANATAVIANNGTLYRPHLVHSTIRADGRETVVPRIVIRNNISSTSALTEVRAGMRSAVTSGSARGLNDLELIIAGKTGTAQTSGTNKPHAWFTGFAPLEDPEIVLAVLVEEGGEGSSTAVPIAKEILKTWQELNLKENR